MEPTLTKSERETLKAMYRLTKAGAEAHTGDLADALEPGDVAIVAVPGSTDAAVVAFLDTLDLRPGVRVEVREKHPFDGPLVLRVAGKDRTLSERVAQQIFVRKVEVHDQTADAIAARHTDPSSTDALQRREQSA